MAYAISLPYDGVLPRGNGRYRSLALLQVLDVATTWFILSQFSGKGEGNPIIAHLISGAGLTVTMLAVLTLKLAVVRVLYEKDTKVNLISAVYGAVIVNNLLALALVVT